MKVYTCLFSCVIPSVIALTLLVYIIAASLTNIDTWPRAGLGWLFMQFPSPFFPHPCSVVPGLVFICVVVYVRSELVFPACLWLVWAACVVCV